MSHQVTHEEMAAARCEHRHATATDRMRLSCDDCEKSWSWSPSIRCDRVTLDPGLRSVPHRSDEAVATWVLQGPLCRLRRDGELVDPGDIVGWAQGVLA
jgi:hypothetical protein